tara:strand:- start:1145 stop:2176 length:1032 start_codon:yes stop_codon:yes gene_type:complete
MALGLPMGLIWDNPPMTVQPCSNPLNVAELIAWYDFTDASTIYRKPDASVGIVNNQNIGRINNKSQSSDRMGIFLRATNNGLEANEDATTIAPLFKTGGVNGYSYANFDTSILSTGQCLVGSDYFHVGAGDDFGHHGGYGNGAGGLGANGTANPNGNIFSNATISNHDLTVFWVFDPTSATPSGSGSRTHWLIRPDIAGQDNGGARNQETRFEANSGYSSNTFSTSHNAEDQNSGSGTAYASGTVAMATGANIFTSKFYDGTNAMSLKVNSTVVASETITTNSTYEMKSGMMSLGRYSLGNVNSGTISNSGINGNFYEILMYNRKLTDSDVDCVINYLENKYT